MENKRVCLEDIGKELGVSKNTVSRALRDCSDISESLKEKVRLKAKEMNYIPNNTSILLRQNISKFIGIITCDLLNPYYSFNIDRLIKVLKAAGYMPITILTNSGYLDFEVLKTLLNYQVQAVISFQDLTLETYNFIQNNNFPVILYGLQSRYPGICSVYSDDKMGGELIAKECLKLERKKVCYITWEDVETSQRREEGFTSILNKNNLNVDKLVIGYNNDFDYLSIILNKEYDFIFAYCDMIANEVITKLKKAGYKNYTIYGFDGVSSYISLCKHIKSVTAPTDMMCNYVLEVIQDLKNTRNLSTKTKIFDVKIC